MSDVGKCPIFDGSGREIFYHQIDFQNARNLSFSEKNLVFVKIGNGSEFAVECVSNDIIS